MKTFVSQLYSGHSLLLLRRGQRVAHEVVVVLAAAGIVLQPTVVLDRVDTAADVAHEAPEEAARVKLAMPTALGRVRRLVVSKVQK